MVKGVVIGIVVFILLAVTLYFVFNSLNVSEKSGSGNFNLNIPDSKQTAQAVAEATDTNIFNDVKLNPFEK